MQTAASAEQLIFEHMSAFGAVSVPVDQAYGAVLRETITAERDQPPFDRVTMDGIAIAFEQWREGLREFVIAGTQAAGEAPGRLRGPGSCLEIMTGAVLPGGADTVIPFERIRVHDRHAVVETDYAVAPGQFIHRRGSDRRRGEPLSGLGVRIGGPEMALLASAGRATVSVSSDPRIAVISNGDELVEIGSPIAEYQVRSCNDRAIEAALRQRGYGRVTRALLPDDPEILERRIGELHGNHEVLILSGGVSMGKYDFVPAILQALAIELVFHKISQRPGLPMWFGISRDAKPVFALPGNPVSSLVCLIRYIVPALSQAMGLAAPKPRWVVLDEAVEFAPRLTYFVPVVLESGTDGVARAHPRPTNTSGDFVSLAGTDGFVELERDCDHFPAGHVACFREW